MYSGTNDYLMTLVQGAMELVQMGYYDAEPVNPPTERWGITTGIERHPFFPIIAEIKLASPSSGIISHHTPHKLIKDYVKGGAAALSVLTEPRRFGGSIRNLELIESQDMPVLMKDIIVSETQVRAAANFGASAVLLIQGAFPGLIGRQRRDELIDRAHELGLEVVLEGHHMIEMYEVLASEADVIGINQRDLNTLTISHGHGKKVLPLIRHDPRPIVVMSGLRTRDDVVDMRDTGADAVLIGSELSACYDPMARLHQLVVPR